MPPDPPPAVPVTRQVSANDLRPEELLEDPEALILEPPEDPPSEGAIPQFQWTLPEQPPPRHLGSDFRALWTANEATVLQAIPQLDTLAALRYSPTEGTTSLPLPGATVIGPVRGFTTVWINGGVIAWGGVSSMDEPAPGGDDLAYSNEGALLVLPDR
jgi:hypothetical protein